MRLLQTGDWHLGRTLFGTDLIADQRALLGEFVSLARSTRPDAILVAGDIYDRAVPHPDAVALLDDTLSRLVTELRIPVVVVAGNHDNPVRLGFASELLAATGLLIAGPPAAEPLSLQVKAAGGPWRIWALPYTEPVQVAALAGDPSLRGHEAAMGYMLDRIRERFRPGEHNVLVGHAWVTGGESSESERPLSVGGTGEVPASLFEGFAYVALGHLHRPQSLAGGTIRYAGSLLPYSLSEVSHAKSVTVADLAADTPALTEHTLPGPHGFRHVTGPFTDLLRLEPSDDYLWVTYTDPAPQHAAAERLRDIWPNLLQVTRAAEEGLPAPGSSQASGAAEIHAKGLAGLFRDFLGQTANEPITESQGAALDSLVDEFSRLGRGE